MLLIYGSLKRFYTHFANAAHTHRRRAKTAGPLLILRLNTRAGSLLHVSVYFSFFTYNLSVSTSTHLVDDFVSFSLLFIMLQNSKLFYIIYLCSYRNVNYQKLIPWKIMYAVGNFVLLLSLT